jgi:hypothetical protein
MKRLLLSALMLGMVSANTAQAGPISYTFEGAFAPGYGIGEELGWEHSFSGTFVYDPDAELLSSVSNRSDWLSGVAHVTVTVLGVTYETVSPVGYWTMDNYYIIGTGLPNDTFDLLYAGASMSGYPYTLGLLFGDRDLDVFASPASVLPMSLEGFDVIALEISYGDYNAEGRLTAFEPVPDAGSSLLLLGMGLASIGVRRQRRQ